MKIGIFAPWGVGDLCLSTCVLVYKDRLWPNSQIIWFVSSENKDLLRHNPYVYETREWPFPWAQTKPEWTEARGDTHGELRPSKLRYAALSDLDCGYFSTPWLNTSLLYLPFAAIPQRIFGIPDTDPWHPAVYYSKEEEAKANSMVERCPKRFNVMIETHCKSGQSLWTASTTEVVVAECRRSFGDCNFFFASRNNGRQDGTDCSSLSARECIPLYNRMDLFIGCTSGISCVTCSWQANRNVRRIQFCIGKIGTMNVAFGNEKVAENTEELKRLIRESK